MRDISTDIRYAVRSLLRRPAFTAIAVLTIALGIGANTAIFTVVNAVLLRPPPFEEPSRLVALWEASRQEAQMSVSYPDFLDWEQQSQDLESVAVIDDHDVTLTGAGDPERLDGARASANLFAVVGVRPVLGRGFVPADDRPGAGRVALLSHGLWQRRFGGARDVVGRTVVLNQVRFEIIGVLPSSLDGQSFGWFRDIDIWLPLGQYVEGWASRGAHNGPMAIGRLARGVSLEDARAELDVVAKRLEVAYPESNAGIRVVITPLARVIAGERRQALWLLLGAVGFVLIIACANVSSLLLARGLDRRRELAIRTALGARPDRLVRLLLVESVALACAGGALGLLVAGWATDALVAMAPTGFVREAPLDGRVLAFTALVSLVSGLLTGALPALRGSRVDPEATLRDARRSSTGRSGSGSRSLLVVAEVAMATTVVVGAGLLLRSAIAVSRVDPGFDPAGLLTVQLSVPLSTYPDVERQTAFYADVLARVESLPGVQSAGATSDFPILDDSVNFEIQIDGRPAPAPGEQLLAYHRAITPGYLHAMRIPLLAGRDVDTSDDARSQPVALINQAMARRHWPGADPIGDRVRLGFGDNPWLTIVGVVGDVTPFGLETVEAPAIYVPHAQRPFAWMRWMTLAIRAEGDPASLTGPVRDEIWAVDPDVPLSDVQSGTAIVARSFAARRFTVLAMSLFAALALVLASIGLYGVLAFVVGQQSRDIGIRMMLGADARTLVGSVVRTGIALAGVGLATGLAGAVVLGRTLRSQLFGVSAFDPITMLGVVLLLAITAGLAAYLPARRAAAVDPAEVLRST